MSPSSPLLPLSPSSSPSSPSLSPLSSGNLGADSIYKSLEGKISSYSDIINKKNVSISEDNIINKEDA